MGLEVFRSDGTVDSAETRQKALEELQTYLMAKDPNFKPQHPLGKNKPQPGGGKQNA